MKILHVIPFFSPKFGGSVTVLYELSKELAKKNHEVIIITTDFGFDSQYAKKIQVLGVRVISFHCLMNLGSFFYSPSMKNWLANHLKEFNVIQLHNYRSYQNYIVHSYAKKFRIPYIMQAHGSVLPLFEKQNLKKLYDFVWGNKILADASKFIAVSKIEREQYIKMGLPENKIEIIPNGIDVSEYAILPERGNFRKEWGIGSEEKVILYLGRVHKSKGLDFLINSFSRMLTINKNIKLVIVGPDDGFLDSLMKQINRLGINKNIIFTGALYENKKHIAFVNADLLVYPGIFEIFGLVPFEAIMCGTPVIVTDGCGCGDIIKEANCGNRVKYGDTVDLVIKMSELLENSQAAKETVILGQQYINTSLKWEKIILKFEDLYENCLRNI